MADSEIIGPGGELSNPAAWSGPALQALYHSVTGKTDNYSKSFKKHVVITYNDIHQLHQKIIQQIAHYNVVASPAVTVEVKQYKGSTIRYNSFQKFAGAQAHLLEVTSEFNVKYEFLLQLPDAPGPQRYIVNIALDSGLPVVAERSKDGGFSDSSFIDFFVFSEIFESLKISVDYIDFLFARISCPLLRSGSMVWT